MPPARCSKRKPNQYCRTLLNVRIQIGQHMLCPKVCTNHLKFWQLACLLKIDSSLVVSPSLLYRTFSIGGSTAGHRRFIVFECQWCRCFASSFAHSYSCAFSGIGCYCCNHCCARNRIHVFYCPCRKIGCIERTVWFCLHFVVSIPQLWAVAFCFCDAVDVNVISSSGTNSVFFGLRSRNLWNGMWNIWVCDWNSDWYYCILPCRAIFFS